MSSHSRVGGVRQLIGTPAARIQQAKKGAKTAAVVGVGVVAAGLAAAKAAVWSLHHPITIFKFMLMGSLFPLYMVHHVDQNLQRALHRATSSLSCSAGVPMPVGGVQGDAALVGASVHHFALTQTDANHLRSVIIHGSQLAGETVGTIWRVFTETLGGAPRPMEPPPPAIPPGNLVAFRNAAGCCPTSSSPLSPASGGQIVSFRTSVVPGDSPAMAATRAAAAAGFAGNDLLNAVAVAGAESGYQPSATNANTNGTIDYGEWQINSVHPEILATGNWRDIGDNARMAFQIERAKGNWSDWSSFNSGRYRAWLATAQQALNAVAGIAGPPIPLAEPALDPRVSPASCTPFLGGPGIVNFRPGAPAVEAAIHFAIAQLGKPYVFGATGPNSWDCSSLTQAAYRAAGVNLGRTTFQQINDGIGVPVGTIQRGDLIFTEPGHVMLALGDGTAIEAPHTGDVVKIVPISLQLWAARRVAGIPAAAFAAA